LPVPIGLGPVSRMSLSKKVKVGLDETRILILGSQILLGFQFQAAFRPTFETLPFHDRLIWLAAIGAITLTVALLITPSVQHRTVEGGQDTKRLLALQLLGHSVLARRFNRACLAIGPRTHRASFHGGRLQRGRLQRPVWPC
jgi:Family of unknown function (DUF6328)